jgi:hypothetical protein
VRGHRDAIQGLPAAVRAAAILRYQRTLSRVQLFGTKDFDTGRCCEDRAELAHPVIGVFGAAAPPMAKLIELIEVRKLDFELQGRTARMTSGQWNPAPAR